MDLVRDDHKMIKKVFIPTVHERRVSYPPAPHDNREGRTVLVSADAPICTHGSGVAVCAWGQPQPCTCFAHRTSFTVRGFATHDRLGLGATPTGRRSPHGPLSAHCRLFRVQELTWSPEKPAPLLTSRHNIDLKKHRNKKELWKCGAGTFSLFGAQVHVDSYFRV
jgi:hypothetical protein